MSPLTESTRIVLAKSYALPDDADAVAYIAAVEAADGQALETATCMAINAFVVGCKADGTWPALKASCILAGARTLAGALVPLVGTAPTNVNFVSGDYNRKTGLVGDGSTKYLNSNRNNNADPQNSKHLSCYIATANTASDLRGYIGTNWDTSGASLIGRTDSARLFYAQCNSSGNLNRSNIASTVGFHGVSRSSSAILSVLANAQIYLSSTTSNTPQNASIRVYDVTNARTNARIAFYSIGESLDLALLDTRVTALITAFAAAIP